ncbi:DUF2155 domain-containing protein [Gluconacetobacter diazotrophicus]|uniref:DUF2155 domain-containing protein n=1 Tax=Gluconacetobacter diazotrophicus (strain ATCC 49037 / DSM 5601 / CCUG 37298 / CIP 103539 / LMG 7603 / PAl5) TaxID=272568 RepID=A9HBU0_GLUDA|nr:DUF2155 domain-containing protein [Gluconacetobacter diazotrophicus]CAP54857.1 conserved hypothetical protein [Gluconacetobacter diazotrophicus PA1 5]
MRLILSLAVLSAVPVGIAARAAEMVPPPLVYPADTWQGRSVATVRVLDGLDSHVQSLTIPVGQDVTYRALTIHVGACRDRPATLVPDSAGWLTIRDTRQDGRGFDGWMLAGEPFLGVFQDPVYTVQIVSCTGDIVAPIPPPLTVAATAAGQGAQAAPGVQVQGAQTQGVQIQSTQVQVPRPVIRRAPRRPRVQVRPRLPLPPLRPRCPAPRCPFRPHPTSRRLPPGRRRSWPEPDCPFRLLRHRPLRASMGHCRPRCRMGRPGVGAGRFRWGRRRFRPRSRRLPPRLRPALPRRRPSRDSPNPCFRPDGGGSNLGPRGRFGMNAVPSTQGVRRP